MNDTEIDELLAHGSVQIDKLHKIVRDTLKAEKLIIHNLLHPPEEKLTKAQLISDKVAQFGGSWKFIIIFGVILTIWIGSNIVVLEYRFDPYPFILMNLVLSCVTALQAPIIMMSQNRQGEKDRMQSENDYLINLKAEMQIRSINQKIDLLLEEQIKTLFEIQEKQFAVLSEIHSKLEISLVKVPE